MNIAQKVVIAAGAVLAALRAVFPVKYAEVPGFRFSGGGDFPEFMQKVDWAETGTHIGVIAAAVVVLAFVFADRKKGKR